jgi:hypothetical protein
VTDYELWSDAFAEDWMTVWPVDAGIGNALHERSWPDRAAVLRTNDFLEGLGRFKKIRKAADVQEELARRYSVIQEHVCRDVCLDDMLPHVLLSPVPPGTEFTKFTVRAEYVLVTRAQTRPPIDHDAAVELARHDVLAFEGAQLIGSTEATVGGVPAIIASSRRPGENGTGAYRRAVVLYPGDREAVGRLQLHTDFDDTGLRIDDVLGNILNSLKIVEEEPEGVEA